MFPRLCSPYPHHGVELLGAESLQSPTLTGPPARGSPDTLILQITLYKSCSTLFLQSGRHFLGLVLVLSLFSLYNVIKLLFWFIILADALNPRISLYILARCRLHLGFLEKLVLKTCLTIGQKNATKICAAFRAKFPNQVTTKQRHVRCLYSYVINIEFLETNYRSLPSREELSQGLLSPTTKSLTLSPPGGVLRISSDGDNRMGANIKTQKNP